MSTPDSFDSPDGRTYSAPETAGQADVPALFARWFRVVSRNASDEDIARCWREAISADRRFWTETQAAIAAAAPAPAGEGGGMTALRSGDVLTALRIFATDGRWLTCEDDGRLDMRKELLAIKAVVREALKDDPQPQAAPALAEPVTVEGVLCRDYPAVVTAMQAACDRRQVLILRLTDERGLARAETAGIKAAAANTARELAEVTDKLAKAKADRNSARNVVAEMVAHWERTGTTREEDELIPQWLKAAGLTS